MIDIYADGASLDAMREIRKNPLVCGWTTNPSLMRQSGVKDYEAFAKEALDIVEGQPISFEVFSDDIMEMEHQARKISSWGFNINVKIPVTNTKGECTSGVISNLTNDGIKCNVTAVFTLNQVGKIVQAINHSCDSIISIFAGRIADTGIDPLQLMHEAVVYTAARKRIKILWASPREVLNIKQAERAGCHIITIPPDILKKMSLFGKDLTQFSLETVRMFYDDAQKAGYQL